MTKTGTLGASRSLDPLSSCVPAASKKKESPADLFPAAAGHDMYTAVFSTKGENGTHDDGDDTQEGVFAASVTEARYLTAGGAKAERRVVHLELAPSVTTSSGPFGYKVGDAIGVECENDTEDVAAVLLFNFAAMSCVV